MKYFKCRFLLLAAILFMCNNVRAITFAERYHCDTLFQLGTGQQLQKWHDTVLKDLRKLENRKADRQSIAHYYALLCECSQYQGHYKKALVYAQKAEKIYQQLVKSPEGDPKMVLSPDYALVCHYVGRLNTLLMTNFQKSLDYHTECGKITADWCTRLLESNNKELLAQHRNNLLYTEIIMEEGEIMIDLTGHNYSSAIKAGQEAIKDIKDFYQGKEAQHIEYIDVLLLLSNVYLKAQDYEQALRYTREAQQAVEKKWGRNNTTYARILHTMAVIYFQLNDRKSIHDYLFRSIDIYEKTGHTTHAEYAHVLELLGQMYQSLSITKEARKYYDKALDVIKISCGEECFHVLLNRYYDARSLMQEGHYLEVFLQMDKIFENQTFTMNLNGDHVISAMALYYESALKSGRYQQILDRVSDSEEILDLLGEVGQSEANNLFISMGRIYQAAQRQTDACKAYQKALGYFKDMARRNFAFLSEEQRISFWDRDELNFEHILLQNKYANDDLQSSIGKLLYNAALLQKGLLLNTSVNMARIIEEKGPESLKRDMRRLQLMMQSNLKTKEEQQACRQLEQQVVQEARKYGDFMGFTEYTWLDIQKSMTPRDVAIEFVSAGDDTRIYVSAEILRNNRKAPQHIFLFSYQRADDLSFMQISAKYIQSIRQKILPQLKPGDNVYFAPVGELYQLPMEYIELAKGKRMDEVYHMYRVSSTRELITMKKHRQPQKKIVLFGGLNYNSSIDDMEMQAMLAKEQTGSTSRGNHSKQWQYLSGTMEEVNSISKSMQEAKYKVTLFTQEEGVEEQFKALSDSHTGIIHIATHGFYESGTVSGMEHAGLIFAGANNFWASSSAENPNIDNGILTATEIANLNLIGTDLVVLSACQTGLGKVTGEGLFGLQRAFKKAGVQSILMSLWEVDDKATQVMMTAFYRYLKAGNTKREALRKAQAQVRQKEFVKDGKIVSGSDPNLWGAFILID